MPVSLKEGESSPLEPDKFDHLVNEAESFEDLENKVKENDDNGETITCPEKTDYLEKWSEQVPVYGELSPYIKKCL